MSSAFPKRISSVFATISDGLIGLVREIAPAVLFFFIAFLLIFILFKLFVSQYAIEFSALSKAAVAALQKAGLYDEVKGKLVYGENISQAAQFAESGNAQAGILALSPEPAQVILGPSCWPAGK